MTPHLRLGHASIAAFSLALLAACSGLFGGGSAQDSGGRPDAPERGIFAADKKARVAYGERAEAFVALCDEVRESQAWERVSTEYFTAIGTPYHQRIAPDLRWDVTHAAARLAADALPAVRALAATDPERARRIASSFGTFEDLTPEVDAAYDELGRAGAVAAKSLGADRLEAARRRDDRMTAGVLMADLHLADEAKRREARQLINDALERHRPRVAFVVPRAAEASVLEVVLPDWMVRTDRVDGATVRLELRFDEPKVSTADRAGTREAMTYPDDEQPTPDPWTPKIKRKEEELAHWRFQTHTSEGRHRNIALERVARLEAEIAQLRRDAGAAAASPPSPRGVPRSYPVTEHVATARGRYTLTMTFGDEVTRSQGEVEAEVLDYSHDPIAGLGLDARQGTMPGPAAARGAWYTAALGRARDAVTARFDRHSAVAFAQAAALQRGSEAWVEKVYVGCVLERPWCGGHELYEALQQAGWPRIDSANVVLDNRE